MNAACRTFLRDLATHAAQPAGAGGGSHADACPSCAERVRVARAHAAWLRRRPAVPAALRERDLFDSVLAHASDAAEAGPIGRLLREQLPVAPEQAQAWPVPLAEGGPDRAGAPAGAGTTAVPPMAVDASAVPAWVWQRVKADILAEAGAARRDVPAAPATRRRASRALILVAGIACAAAGVVLSATEILGQPAAPEPEIVMRRLPVAPLVDYSPTAILRHGRGE